MQHTLVVAGARRAGTASVASAIAGVLDLPVRESAAGLAFFASIRKARAGLTPHLADHSVLDDALSAAWLERSLPAAGAVWRLADPFPDAAALAALRGLLGELPAVRVIGVQRDVAGFLASRRRALPEAPLLDHCQAWARSTAELDAIQAEHPGRVLLLPLAGIRQDPTGSAQAIADFLGLGVEARAGVAQALRGEVHGRQGMLDGGAPPSLAELALATPELLLVEQICGPAMTRHAEAADVLRHLRRNPLPLPELFRLRTGAQGAMTVTHHPQGGGLTLACEVKAAQSGDAMLHLPALGLAGRSSFTGAAMLAPAAPAEAALHITLTESLSRRTILARQWSLPPGKEVRLAADFGATHELLDVSLRLACAAGAPGGPLSMALDGQFSRKA